MSDELDETDLKILRIVQSHPAMPVSEVAKLVALSHTPCWRRLKRMESLGLIVGRFTQLNARALGLTVCVFAHIRLKQHDQQAIEALEKAMLAHKEILECFSTSGESDFILRIIARNIEEYERFLKQVLLHLPGIGSVNSSFALKCVKLTSELPI